MAVVKILLGLSWENEPFTSLLNAGPCLARTGTLRTNLRTHAQHLEINDAKGENTTKYRQVLQIQTKQTNKKTAKKFLKMLFSYNLYGNW